MSVILWIVIGLLLASVARKVMPGPPAGGLMFAIAIGVAGAIVGGVGSVLFASATWNEVAPHSIMLALLGSLVFLGAYRANALRYAE